jgi:hypothetical protein
MIITNATKVVLVLTVVLVIGLGCRHMVKTDMDTYLSNQEAFKGKQVVFTTDLKDLNERYEIYRGKEVEVTAPFSYFGKWQFWTWYLVLESGGNTIRAYESEYRNYADRYALFLLRVARNEKGSVTVRGKLERNGIELNRLFYKDFAVNTNFRSNRNYSVYY